MAVSEASLESSPFFRSFSCEKKSFKVEHKSTTIRLTETRNRYNSYALFPASLGEWVAETVEGAIGKEGLLSSRSDGDLSIFITRKKNSKGRFINLMFLSPKIKTGAKFIDCPEGREGIGWLNLADSIRSVSLHAISSSQAAQRSLRNPGMLESGHTQPQKDKQKPRPQRNRRGAPATLLVKISQGICLMNQIPSMIHNLIRLSSSPEISATEDPKIFRLKFKAVTDVKKLGEIATLQLKSCSLEFIEEQDEVSVPEVAWSDITTREVNLWGLPESAKSPETIALFITDFGAFRSMEVLKNDMDGKSGIRVTIDHSDLSLMPQLKYFDWDDEVHAIRIIPHRMKRNRRRKKAGNPTTELPESSKTGEERGRGQPGNMHPDAHARQVADTNSAQTQSQQLLCWQGSPTTNTIRQNNTQVPDTQAQAINAPAPLSESVPTFAQVVRGSAPSAGPRVSSCAQKTVTDIPSSSRIADLNKSPMASPQPSPEPQSQVEGILESLIRVGDILGYDALEKQSMVNWTTDQISKDRGGKAPQA